jgi:hypothetical protein
MKDESPPQRTVERKKREATALKANMKKRKEQARSLAPVAKAEKPLEPGSNT